jgi:hypothetical protein
MYFISINLKIIHSINKIRYHSLHISLEIVITGGVEQSHVYKGGENCVRACVCVCALYPSFGRARMTSDIFM